MGRSTVTLAALLVAAAATAGCTDPRLEITLTFDDGLPDKWRAELDVVELTGRGCDAVRLGRVDAADLAKGRRTGAAITITRPADGSPIVVDPITLDGIPRLGDKLLVITGFDRAGRVVGGGCAEVADIETDQTAVIHVEEASVTSVLPGPALDPSLCLPQATALSVVAFKRSGAVLAGADLTVELEDVHGVSVEFPDCRDGAVPDCPAAAGSDDGVLTLTLPGALPPEFAEAVGPVELRIRAPWAAQVQRIPAYIPVRALPRTTLPAGAASEIDPDWVFITATDGAVRAAALVKGPAGTRVLFLDNAANRDVIALVGDKLVTGATPRALAVVPRSDGTSVVVTRLEQGWAELDWSSHDLVVRNVESTTAADQLAAVFRCDGDGADGMVAQAGGGPFVGFAGLTPDQAPAGSMTDHITAQLNQLAAGAPGASATLLGSACVEVPAGQAPAVVLRLVDAAGEHLWLTSSALGAPLALPFVGAPTIASGSKLLVGAVPTPLGLRVRGFRLSIADQNGALIPASTIDHPVAAPPEALVALRANDDLQIDTVAFIRYQGRAAISTTLGSDVPGGEFTSVVDAAEQARFPHVAQISLDASPIGRLALADESGVRLFALDAPAGPQQVCR